MGNRPQKGYDYNRAGVAMVTLKTRAVWSLAEARGRLERLLGTGMSDWMRLDQFLIDFLAEPAQRATALASSFSASLEMVREGMLDLRQDEPFAPLWLRSRAPGSGRSGEGA